MRLAALRLPARGTLFEEGSQSLLPLRTGPHRGDSPCRQLAPFGSVGRQEVGYQALGLTYRPRPGAPYHLRQLGDRLVELLLLEHLMYQADLPRPLRVETLAREKEPPGPARPDLRYHEPRD